MTGSNGVAAVYEQNCSPSRQTTSDDNHRAALHITYSPVRSTSMSRTVPPAVLCHKEQDWTFKFPLLCSSLVLYGIMTPIILDLFVHGCQPSLFFLSWFFMARLQA